MRFGFRHAARLLVAATVGSAAAAPSVVIAQGAAVTNAVDASVEATETATARFLNKSHACSRGERFTARLAVTGANSVVLDVGGWMERTVPVVDGHAEYEIDTALLRAGDYDVRAGLRSGEREAGRALLRLSIGPPRDSERMPIWKWGHIGYEPRELQYWNRMGFTGGTIGQFADPAPRFSSRTSHMRLLDEGIRLDMELGLYLFPIQSKKLQSLEELRGTYASGSRAEKLQPLAPPAIAHARSVANTWTRELAEFPGLRFLFLNSEHETPLAPHPEAARLFREEVGLDLAELPIEEGYRKRGKLAVSPGDFPDGIIDDDHPHYRFLKWWWERGHGTAVLNAAMADAARAIRPDLLNYHDPYRLAPVRHTHKGLDMISTWTYGTPDIKRLIYPTYMQAAARADNLKVFPTITLLLYGFMVMPLEDSTADFQYDFGGSDPFFQVGPDYAREASWLIVSQRPDVLGYYIASSMDFSNPRLDPNVISPPTAGAIAEVAHSLVQPYGPALLDTQRHKPRVALLASAVGAWFHEGGFNSGYAAEQTLPYASLLMMNHVPFDVLLDDDLIEGGADKYDALILPFSATVTRKMAEQLRTFDDRGGKVIVNEPFRLDLPGAVRTKYDFRFEFQVRGTAGEGIIPIDEHRRRMEAYAADLARHVEDFRGPVRSGTRVITNSLDGGDVQYHFLVNDDRAFGTRFDKSRLYFDSAAPQTAEVTVHDKQRPVLYDALRRKRIDAEETLSVEGELPGPTRFTIGLAPGSGALIAALPEPISSINIEAPEQATAGKAVPLRISVIGASGEAIRGSLPLRIDIDDPSGRHSEWSRFSTTRRADEGVCTFTFIPAINDVPGTWTVRIRELVGDTLGEVKIDVSH